MLKEKKPYIVITFPNTVAALSMESACHAAGLPGRIIPVPSQISAGCGFSWRAEVQDQEKLKAFMTEQGITYSEIHEIEL